MQIIYATYQFFPDYRTNTFQSISTINNFIDKYYLGWLIRLIFNPIIFFKKYIIGLRLIPMVIFGKIKILRKDKIY